MSYPPGDVGGPVIPSKLIAYREFDPDWVFAVCDGHVVGWSAAGVPDTGELILTERCDPPRAWLIPSPTEAPTGSKIMGRPVPLIVDA